MDGPLEHRNIPGCSGPPDCESCLFTETPPPQVQWGLVGLIVFDLALFALTVWAGYRIARWLYGG